MNITKKIAKLKNKLYSKDSNSNDFYELLEYSKNLVVAGSVSYLTFMAEKPKYAVLAGMLGITIDTIYNTIIDINKKQLSYREKVRTASCAIYTMNRISARIANGDKLREDGFFEREMNSSRAPSEEVFEGTLIAAKNEHEEKKVKFLGNLIANIAFEPSINRSKANFLVKIMERLDYNQLCIIAMFHKKGIIQLNWGFSFSHYDELMTLNYLEASMEELDGLKILGGTKGGGRTWLSAALKKLGKDIYNLANLVEIESDDVLKIHEDFLRVNDIISEKNE